MGFFHKTSDTGAVPSIINLPAAAGEYSPGQLLTVTDGQLTAITAASNTTPPYVCHSARKIETAGGMLAVNRVRKDVVYKTSLSAAAAEAKIGSKLRISAGGKQVSAGAGTFEIVYIEGTAEDDTVRGRFV